MQVPGARYRRSASGKRTDRAARTDRTKLNRSHCSSDLRLKSRVNQIKEPEEVPVVVKVSHG
jgi:hypothetical protein